MFSINKRGPVSQAGRRGFDPRLPLFPINNLGAILRGGYRKITPLRGSSVDQRRFELLYSFDPAFQRGLGIDVQIQVERMALLIGDDFRVDVLSTHERCMGSLQHLKVDPAETNLPQLINSTNVSTPGFG